LPQTVCAAKRIFSLTPDSERRAICMSVRDLRAEGIDPSCSGPHGEIRSRSLGDKPS
jgi:hypothetical protein